MNLFIATIRSAASIWRKGTIFLQFCKCVDRNVLVFEYVGDLRTYSFQKPSLSNDACNVDVKCLCNSLLRDTSFNRLHDHPMFLDHGEAIDALIVCKGLIIC